MLYISDRSLYACICVYFLFMLLESEKISNKNTFPFHSGCCSNILPCICSESVSVTNIWRSFDAACYNMNILLQAMSVCFAVVAAVTCFCACVFALLHLVFLTSMTCELAHVLNATCVCQDLQRTYHYTDLNCLEVGNILTILLIGSCAANSIGGVLVMWYVFLHWSSRYSYLYSEVKTSDYKPIVFSNKLETRK